MNRHPHARRRGFTLVELIVTLVLFGLMGATLVVFTMAMLFTGLEPVTAFTAVIASVNNIGPGLGEVGPAVNFGGLTDLQTWICTAAMLLGRLELLSVMVNREPA